MHPSLAQMSSISRTLPLSASPSLKMLLRDLPKFLSSPLMASPLFCLGDLRSQLPVLLLPLLLHSHQCLAASLGHESGPAKHRHDLQRFYHLLPAIGLSLDICLCHSLIRQSLGSRHSWLNSHPPPAETDTRCSSSPSTADQPVSTSRWLTSNVSAFNVSAQTLPIVTRKIPESGKMK